MSDLEKLNKDVLELPAGTYVCEIFMHYDHERIAQCERTVLCIDVDGNATWLNDWYEGQEHIELHKCVDINNLILY